MPAGLGVGSCGSRRFFCLFGCGVHATCPHARCMAGSLLFSMPTYRFLLIWPDVQVWRGALGWRSTYSTRSLASDFLYSQHNASRYDHSMVGKKCKGGGVSGACRAEQLADRICQEALFAGGGGGAGRGNRTLIGQKPRKACIRVAICWRQPPVITGTLC